MIVEIYHISCLLYSSNPAHAPNCGKLFYFFLQKFAKKEKKSTYSYTKSKRNAKILAKVITYFLLF